jgi:hypothetical protein
MVKSEGDELAVPRCSSVLHTLKLEISAGPFQFFSSLVCEARSAWAAQVEVIAAELMLIFR